MPTKVEMNKLLRLKLSQMTKLRIRRQSRRLSDLNAINFSAFATEKAKVIFGSDIDLFFCSIPPSLHRFHLTSINRLFTEGAPLKNQLSIFVFFLTLTFALAPIAQAVVHGKPVANDQYLSVVSLAWTASSEQPDPRHKRALARCSGTFISDSVVLTAGHCAAIKGHAFLYSFNDEALAQMIPAIGVATDFTDDDSSEKSDTYVEKPEPDLGLIYFPSGTALQISAINSSWQPETRAPIEYVGYGGTLNPWEDILAAMGDIWTLNKRYGQNIVKSSDGLRFAFEAIPLRTYASDGDSGAPVFANGNVVGVLSARMRIETDLDYIVENHAELLSSDKARAFLKRYLSL
jgi:hypothetical protein